jgi:glutaredoxin
VRVTLLTKPACGFCDDAKAILTRLEMEYPLTIEVIDLASPQGEDLALLGGVLFPPGVFLNGEAFSHGRLSERKLRHELERRAALLRLRAPKPVPPQSG